MAKAYDAEQLKLLELWNLKQPGTTLPGGINKLTSDLPSAIEKVFNKQGYLLFKNPGEMNIVYVEGMNTDGTGNDNAPNKFNDCRIVIAYEGAKPVIRGLWDATTEPGKYWTEHPMNRGGAARIKFGQYTAWRPGQYHDQEALLQTSPITVCRDLNKDYKRTGDKEDTGMFGIYHHWGYDMPKDNLGQSSAGCLVGRTKNGHREFMKLVKSDPRYSPSNKFQFTATVIPFSDL